MKQRRLTSLKTLFLIALVCFAGLVSCKKQASKTDTPESTVENYLKAIDVFDFEQANKYVIKNENTDQVINNIEWYYNSMNDVERKNYLSGKRKSYFIKRIPKTANETTIIAINKDGVYAFGITFNVIKKENTWLIENIQADD